MRIKIVPKEELSEEQKAFLRGKLEADKENELFAGWELPSNSQHLLAVCCIKTNIPIGLIYYGITEGSALVTLWLQPDSRGKKLASEMVCLLIDRLRSEGATRLMQGRILSYKGKDNVASAKLMQRLKEGLERAETRIRVKATKLR